MSSPASYRLHGVAQPEDEVGDDEPVPPPLVAENRGEQRLVLAAPLAVHRVVRAHHRRDPLLGDMTEVREVHLVERPLVGGDVDGEPGVLHRVHREVLHARHHVPLEPAGERGGHPPHVVRVLPVRLLGPPPRRVTQQVHAHRAGVGRLRSPATRARPRRRRAPRAPDRTAHRGPSTPGTPCRRRSPRRADRRRTGCPAHPAAPRPRPATDGCSSHRHPCRPVPARTGCRRRGSRASRRASSATTIPDASAWWSAPAADSLDGFGERAGHRLIIAPRVVAADTESERRRQGLASRSISDEVSHRSPPRCWTWA